MTRTLTARMTYTDGDQFTAVTGSGGSAPLATTAYEEPTGTISPMEALLVALGGCLGISVTPIFRKMRLPITRYEIIVTSALTEQLPRVFETITVEHVIAGANLDLAAIERALTLAETKYCGASAMLGKAASITHHISLVAE